MLPPVVCFAYDPFNAFWKQIQQFAWRYSARPDGSQVLFVEPERWLVALLTHTRRELTSPSARVSWSRVARGAFEKKSERFGIYTPVHWVPAASRARSLDWLDRTQLRVGLKLAAVRHRVRAPLLWVNQPLDLALLDTFGDARGVVFNWTDDWAAFEETEEEKRVCRERVDALLRRADVVITVSEGLRQWAAEKNPRSHAVPNGTDFERLSRAADPKTEPAPEVRDLRGKVLGFIGYITPRMDLPLLAALAERHPDWHFVYVGPRMLDGDEADRYFARPNVHAIGPRPYDQLSSYLAGIDVCTIPYKKDPLSNTADSIKIYDYLASGRPVVANDTAGASRFAGQGVWIADGVEDFERCVEEALADGSPEAVARRQAVAKPHSWDARVQTIVDILREHGLA